MARPAKPRYVIRRATKPEHFDAILAMDVECFPEDDPPDVPNGVWWLVWHDGEPVGYAGAERRGRSLFMSRSGVLPAHRGQGLQMRLIATRIKHAHALNLRSVVTYTIENPHSANNLIRSGFLMHHPEGHDEGTCDWIKPLM